MTDTKARTFEAALTAAGAHNTAKARKLFQRGAVLGRHLDATACDFLRGVAMCDTIDHGVTTPQAVLRVAKSIGSYGDFSSSSPYLREALGESADSLPSAGFVADDLTGLGFAINMTTPGRWLSAAAMVATHEGRYADAEAMIAQAYKVDKLPEGHHLIADTARALNYAAARRWTDALSTAGAHTAYNEADYGRDNTPEVSGEPTFTAVAVCNAIVATAQAHLGNFDSALAGARTLASSKTSPAVVVAQAWLVIGMCLRLTSKPREEVAEALGNAAAAAPARTDIAAALADDDETFVVTSREMIDARTDYWDASTEPSLAAAAASRIEGERNAIVEEAMAELNALIGMESVKRQVEQLRGDIAYNLAVAGAGGQAATSNINYTFQGPPGVGKTTVARILAKILYGLGVVKSDAFVDALRSDLVGRYQGETAQKTRAALDAARGGVFHLDEAYSLVQSDNDTFGQEAMDTIVPFMSDNRGSTCVIFSGYRADMQRLLKTNEGLSSRFARHIIFESYSPSDLADIAAVTASSRGKIMPEAVRDAVERRLAERVIDSMTGQPAVAADGLTIIDKMGNARGATNIVEMCETNIQRRLASYGDLSSLPLETLTTITVDDALAAVDDVVDRVLVV